MGVQETLILCLCLSIATLCSTETLRETTSGVCDTEPREENLEDVQMEFCSTMAYYVELRNNVRENIDDPGFQNESPVYQKDLTQIVDQLSQHVEFLQKGARLLNSSWGVGKAPVAFSASTSFTRTDEIIKYENVDVNIQNVYDKNTGVFTAPFPGLYNFYARTKCRFYSFLHCSVSIFKNHVSWKGITIAQENSSDEISTVMELKANDTVFVKIVEGTVKKVPFDKYNVFQGYRMM